MTRLRRAAVDAGRNLWVRAAGNAESAEDFATTAAAVWSQVRAGLERWIGVSGYCSLLERALGITREDHPWTGSFAAPIIDEATLRSAVQTLGRGEAAAGMVTLVTALIDLLGRIIGDEMAVRLVEQVGAPSPRGVVSTEKEETRDGQ